MVPDSKKLIISFLYDKICRSDYIEYVAFKEMNKLDKKNLKESVTDTAIAMPIAWILSYSALALMLALGVVNAFYISIVQTLVLTIVSVIRKYWIRSIFKKNDILKMDTKYFDEISYERMQQKN